MAVINDNNAIYSNYANIFPNTYPITVNQDLVKMCRDTLALRMGEMINAVKNHQYDIEDEAYEKLLQELEIISYNALRNF